MDDRDTIVSAFDTIISELHDAYVIDIAEGMRTVALGYHDAFQTIKEQVLAPVDRYSVRAELLEPQPKDDHYHDTLSNVWDIREKTR